MTNDNGLQRRELIAGLAGLGAVLGSAVALAEAGAQAGEHAGHVMNKDAVPPPVLSPQHQAVIRTASDCLRTGRCCLARCTDHLAAGTDLMAECQRAVMNMLAVVGAMADVAGYANTSQANLVSLASSCARFCRSCAQACEPHAAHHEECKACQEACLDCARACEALVG